MEYNFFYCFSFSQRETSSYRKAMNEHENLTVLITAMFDSGPEQQNVD